MAVRGKWMLPGRPVCAVDQDIGPFLPPGKELHIFLEEVPRDALIPYGEEHVADPLAAQVGIRVENPHIVAVPPVTGMTIGKVAQDIVLDHGVFDAVLYAIPKVHSVPYLPCI